MGKFKGKVFFWGNLCGGCLSTTMLEFVSINTTHLGRFVSTTVCVVSNIQSLSYVYVDNILCHQHCCHCCHSIIVLNVIVFVKVAV